MHSKMEKKNVGLALPLPGYLTLADLWGSLTTSHYSFIHFQSSQQGLGAG